MRVAKTLGVVDRGDEGGGSDGADAGDGAQARHARVLDGEVLDRCVGVRELRFDAVTPVDRKRTFWRTETALIAAHGNPVATASIVFRGGADYSARQLAYFRPRTPPETFARMFPNYAI